jgi:hypothetical protein
MDASGNCYGFHRADASCRPRNAFALFAALAFGAGCHDPDPRSIEGALAAAASAIEAGDRARLFRVVDQRARHALASIVRDRREAALLVARDYPEDVRGAAHAALGDAADATDAAGLFARRCDRACTEDLARRIGAPAHTERDGVETVVHTAREETLRLHRGDDGWWGLVWNTAALSRERDRAAQDLVQIRANAEIYRKQRALEADAR